MHECKEREVVGGEKEEREVVGGERENRGKIDASNLQHATCGLLRHSDLVPPTINH